MRKIKTHFIPVVGEHLQLTRGEDRDWWSKTVKQANPQFRDGTTQGYYVLAPDGTGLFWDNYIPRIATALDRGLAAFRRDGTRPANVTPDERRRFAPQAPPEGTSILRLYTRITPVPAEADAMNRLLGRDYMWILKDEVQEILRASQSSEQEFEMPASLVARMTVFHLVDNVRGQVWGWQPRDVRRASFRVRKLSQTGDTRTFRLNGEYAKQSSNPPHWRDRGQEGRIEGTFDVDVRTAVITRFRMFSENTAWSDQGGNVRPPSGRYRLLTVAVEATDDLATEIPPEQAATGQFYLLPRLNLR